MSGPESSPSPRRLPHPILNAMLICDEVRRDDQSGKVTLDGIFEQILASACPAQHPQLAVYVKFTDALGEYPFQLDLIHLETARIVASLSGTVEATDRMGAVELGVTARNLTLPEPGLYEWRLQVNSRYLGSKTFTVLLSTPPAGG